MGQSALLLLKGFVEMSNLLVVTVFVMVRIDCWQCKEW